ncbi:TPA: hypothetical protein ACGH7L_004217, partial [Shigella flexneri]
MVRVIICHQLNTKTNIISGSEVSRLSVAIHISASTEYLAVGVGIPAYSCLDAPGSYKAGYAICRSADFNSWEYVPDHRG